jgi:hypothetical protein
VARGHDASNPDAAAAFGSVSSGSINVAFSSLAGGLHIVRCRLEQFDDPGDAFSMRQHTPLDLIAAEMGCVIRT